MRALALCALLQPLAARANSISLDPLIIGASLAPAEATSAAITILDRQTIAASGLVFVGDLLRGLPSLAISQSGPAGAAAVLRLRGHEAKHSLVLIDGVEMNTGFAYDLAHLPLASVERIEIIRGAQSVIHGAGAIGGVLNIITRQPAKTAAELGLETGSFASRLGYFYLAANEPMRVAVQGSFLQTGNIDLSTAGPDEDDPYRNHQLGVKWEQQTALGALAASGQYRRGRFASDNYDRQPDDQNPASEDIAREAGWRIGWTPPLVHRALTQQIIFSGLDYKIGGESAAGDYERPFVREQLEYRLGASGENWQADILAGWENAAIPATRRRETRFAAVEVKVLNLSGAFRQESTPENDDVRVWRLGGWYDWRSWRLRANYGTAIHDPALAELYGGFGSNPLLQREESAGWDAALRWQGESGAIMEIGWFDEDLDNEIVYDSAQSLLVNLTGASQRRGVELAVFAPLTDTLSFDLAYSWLDAKSAGGEEELRRPDNEFRLAARWQIRPRLALSLTGNWRSAQQDIGGVRLASYALVSTRLSWEIASSLNVYVRGENVLDEDYQEAAGYQTRGAGVFFGLAVRH